MKVSTFYTTMLLFSPLSHQCRANRCQTAKDIHLVIPAFAWSTSNVSLTVDKLLWYELYSSI